MFLFNKNKQDNKNKRVKSSSSSSGATTAMKSSGGPASLTPASGQQQSKTELRNMLLEVVENKRTYPLRQQDFQEHLDGEYCGENLRFYKDSELHKALCEEKAYDQAKQRCMEIKEKYINVNAEEEINISDKDRQTILEKMAEESQQAMTEPSIFDKARLEMIRMMEGEIFSRFLKSRVDTNISSKEVFSRRVNGFAWLTAGVLLLLALLLLQFYDVFPMANRAWRLLTIPCFHQAYGYLYSAQMNFCPDLGKECKRMEKGQTWNQAMSNNDKLADDYALVRYEKLVSRHNIRTWGALFVTLVIIMVIPPGYGIGGGV